MRNQPSFTTLAILTLAIGVGSATTIFSVIQNVLLSPFPYTNPENIVNIYIHDLAGSNPFGRSDFNVREFLAYQQENQVFEEVIGGGNEDILYKTNEGVEYFNGSYVTSNTFQMLGVPALLGRALIPDDANPNSPPVFTMAYKLWVHRFNSDPSIVGKTFNLNGVPTTLVGVMPRRFTKRGADLWRVQPLDPASPGTAQKRFQLQARLKPGVTLKQVETDINIIAHRLAQVYPDMYPNKFDVRAVTWLDSLVRQFRTSLYTLAAAVSLLLLIACGNVANMLLAQSTTREREMAIRASVGASRGRIARQLLMESLALAIAGASGGCLFAYFGIEILTKMLPELSIPGEAVISLNLPALVFSLCAAVVTACLFGLVPAIHASRKDIAESLKSGGKGFSGGFRKGRLRNTLVVIEVALSLMLLTGAGLFMRSFMQLQSLSLGFSPDHILISRMPFPKGQYDTASDKQLFFESLFGRLSVLPGVVSIAASTTLPPFGGVRGAVDIVGTSHSERWQSITTLCNEQYFRTLGIRLLSGRLLSEVDVHNARKVVVINQALANKYLGDQSPIGRQIRLIDLESLLSEPLKANATFEIIGVVSDVNNQGLYLPPMPEVFVPHTITGGFERTILVKTSVDPLTVVAPIQREIWALNPNVALYRTDSFENFMKRYLYADSRFSMILLAAFAGVGLALLAVGVYSVISYAVSQQTQEIGVRLALGASRSDVFLMVLRMCGRLLGVGVLAGMTVSVVATRVLTYQLTNVSPHDPLTLTVAVAVVIIAGLLACYVPASRAMRVDPVVALRNE